MVGKSEGRNPKMFMVTWHIVLICSQIFLLRLGVALDGPSLIQQITLSLHGWVARNAVKSFDNYDLVVRMNRRGIQSGIFQCVLEIRASDHFANEVSLI